MGDNDSELVQQVQHYRKVVLLYEALDKQIDELIMAHGGASENMLPEDHDRYREMARERDELLNEMRRLEQELLDDDEMES